MRKTRPKYPQPREVGPVLTVLQLHIPVDEPLVCGMRESMKHVPNYRIQGLTSGVRWTVDVYRSGFLCVQAGEFFEQFKSIFLMLNFLKYHLNV